MRLKETQRIFAAALMHPPGSPGSLAVRRPRRAAAVRAAEALVRASSHLGPAERIEIYRRSYWCRLLDSFLEDYPGLAAVVGETGVRRLALAYLSDCPSRSYTLRNLGSRLEAWLAGHREFGGARPDLAVEMARLEWAHIQAFDGPEMAPLEPERLSTADGGLRLRLQPYLSLLSLRYPVDEIRLQAPSGCAGAEEARSGRAALRARIRALKPSPEPIHLAVHRFEMDVYYRRLDAIEFHVLASLRSGRTLGFAVETVSRRFARRAVNLGESLESGFAAWSRLRWLVPREPAKERKPQ